VCCRATPSNFLHIAASLASLAPNLDDHFENVSTILAR
jgi:hypothetical protein